MNSFADKVNYWLTSHPEAVVVDKFGQLAPLNNKTKATKTGYSLLSGVKEF